MLVHIFMSNYNGQLIFIMVLNLTIQIGDLVFPILMAQILSH